ncbi:hypothetical protein IG631_18295 [Alternaria alternata]|nr:hypothetical protein IG631_18295 [Alternaria alternata]
MGPWWWGVTPTERCAEGLCRRFSTEQIPWCGARATWHVYTLASDVLSIVVVAVIFADIVDRCYLRGAKKRR